jgi:hypothetical protein
MTKNIKLFLTLLTLLTLTSTDARIANAAQTTATMQPVTQQQVPIAPKKVPRKKQIKSDAIRLSQFPFKSASVQPYYTNDKGERCFIIAQEAAGSNRGDFCDFGGSREKGEDHPFQTAAHEFFEEAILRDTVGFTIEHTRHFIDLNQTNNNTKVIIAYTNNKKIYHVCYIVDFTEYKDQLCKKFAAARKHAKDWKFREKLTLAVVCETDLKDALTPKRSTFIGRWLSNWFGTKKKPITVSARVQDPKTGAWMTQDIPLRPIYVRTMRPYLLNKPFKCGVSNKIRFYTE